MVARGRGWSWPSLPVRLTPPYLPGLARPVNLELAWIRTDATVAALPEPGADAVLIVLARTTDALPASKLPLELLSAEEQRRAGRFLDARACREFVTGRVLLRRLLGQALDRPPAELPIEIDSRGRPWLALSETDCEFSLAHADGLVALALARGARVGVDLEPASRSIDSWRELADPVLAEGEIAAIESLPEDARTVGFLRAWVAKEAVLKVLGTGLLADPRTAVVDGLWRPGEVPRVVALPGGALADGWELELPTLVPGWLMAIARLAPG